MKAAMVYFLLSLKNEIMIDTTNVWWTYHPTCCLDGGKTY
jgi:hypothetical protein